jgi:hypothetical protein
MALRSSQPRDKIIVRAGIYPNMCASNYVASGAQGTSVNPIWVRGEAGAIVDCGEGASGTHTALQLVGVKYLILDNLEFRNAGVHVLQIYNDGGSRGNPTGLLLKGIRAHHAGEACLKVSKTDDISVEDSDFSNAGLAANNDTSFYSGQVLDFVGVHNGRIIRSKVHDALGNGQGSLPNALITFKGGSQDIQIAHNDLWNAETAVYLGGYTGGTYFYPATATYEGLRVVAYSNLIRSSMQKPFQVVGCHQCAVYNNTTYADVPAAAVRALTGNAYNCTKCSHTIDLQVKNNIFYFSASAAPFSIFQGAAADTGGLVQANNLWYAPGKSIAAMPSEVAVTGTPGVKIDQDPKFVAAPTNLALQPASPAKGSGVTTSYDGTFHGACRTAPWNIGAY